MNQNTSISRRQAGFTLIEMMIVIGVVSLLMFVAYPSYQNSAKDARRADAQTALVSFAGAMERHFTTNNSYLDAGQTGDTGAPAIFQTATPFDSSNKHYNLTIEAATGSSYTLRASPLGGQADDGFMQLTSIGQRQWDKNNNGSIGTGEFDWNR